MFKKAKNYFVDKSGAISMFVESTEKFTPVIWIEYKWLGVVILLLTSTIDAAIFHGMFQELSNDNPDLIAIQILAFVLAFDFIPYLVGLQLKRMEYEGKSQRNVIIFSLLATAVAFFLNISVRILTLSANGSDPEANMEAYAILLTACILPFITSVVGFTSSYYCCDYKQEVLKKYHRIIDEKTDKLRKVKALLFEYEITLDHEEKLLKQDLEYYRQAKGSHRALVLQYTKYVRAQLMRKMTDPAMISALSADCNAAVMEDYLNILKVAGIPDALDESKNAKEK